MNICIFGNYEIEYENHYCYINEDGDHSNGVVRQKMILDGGRFLEKIAKYIMNPDFFEMTVTDNCIYIGLFNPADGTCDDIIFLIKEFIQNKEDKNYAKQTY